MKIKIDEDSQGNPHWICIAEDYPLVQHPDNRTGLVSVETMLLHHNANPKSREVGGWHVKNQLAGESESLTRWQRLVRAANHPDAHPAAKALGLKE